MTYTFLGQFCYDFQARNLFLHRMLCIEHNLKAFPSTIWQSDNRDYYISYVWPFFSLEHDFPWFSIALGLKDGGTITGPVPTSFEVKMMFWFPFPSGVAESSQSLSNCLISVMRLLPDWRSPDLSCHYILVVLGHQLAPEFSLIMPLDNFVISITVVLMFVC